MNEDLTGSLIFRTDTIIKLMHRIFHKVTYIHANACTTLVSLLTLDRAIASQTNLDPMLPLLASTAPLPSFNRYCFGHATFSFGHLFATLLFPLHCRVF